MKRRELIAGLGATAAWTLAARAQQGDRMRRIGVLVTGSEVTNQPHLGALREGLQKQGWMEGQNLRIDVRSDGGDSSRVPASAEDLISLAPSVIVVTGALQTRALQQRTQTIPIVFVQVGDPVASGVVKSIAHPEGNTTGVTNLFPTIAGKWLELLKEAMPRFARAAVVFNPSFPVSEIYITNIEASAKAVGVKIIRTPIHSTIQIERALDAFAADPDGAVVYVPPGGGGDFAELIHRLAVQHRLPVINWSRLFTAAGGLMSYGPDSVELYRRAASYVDRLLRGSKPGELPVEFPTKFELVINLKTAKAIGLIIPETFLLRADELIE
jgi:putative ABC transport system substrate-binding protein